MSTKTRNRKFRREQMSRDKAKRGKQAGPRAPKREAYDRDERVNVRAELNTKWGWL
jgi:hypothetical protein